ncbi:MAG: hypothetical protein KAR06_03820 [Deltaproteobacteria bacterium]|nr:hypothetical protein [Deltaproteobacteria bacterium]
MSEESLLADAESTPNEESTETTAEEATPWYSSEGIAGEGDKPDWFNNDKYKSVADQAAAYPELASKFGGFTGAPEDYEMSMPDGIDGEVLADDPLMGEFQTWAKENNLNQDGFTNILHMFIKNEHDTMGQNRESELAAIGDNAQQRLQNINDFARANLSEDDYAGISELAVTAAGVKGLEAMIALTRAPKLPDNSETVIGMTHSEIKERMNDPRYQSDPAFRKETSEMYVKLLGSGPQSTTIG